MFALAVPLAASYMMMSMVRLPRAPAAAHAQVMQRTQRVQNVPPASNATQAARSMLFRGVEGSEGSVDAFWSTCQYLGHDAPQLEEALLFASSAHAGQRRKSGEPYIVHPIETATILAELRMDTDTVIAGLLHDTVEDTDVSADDIRRKFGNGVANIVEGVTDGPKGVPDETNQCALLLAMSMDWRIVLVKLADRLHNMRTLGAMPREKQIRKAQETMSIFVPLAREVGVSQLEEELETLHEGAKAWVELAPSLLTSMPALTPAEGSAECFVRATVSKIDGDKCVVKTEGGVECTVPSKLVMKADGGGAQSNNLMLVELN